MAQTVVLRKRPEHSNFGIYIGEDVPSGIYIVTIEPNSPATEANIQPGDRVLAFNETASNTQTLTLSIQRTNVLSTINEPTSYPLNNGNNQYPSTSTNYIDNKLENYIKSIFSDPTLHIAVAPSNNPNEYVLFSDREPLQLNFPRPSERRRPRRHRSQKESTNAIRNTQNNLPLTMNNTVNHNAEQVPLLNQPSYNSVPQLANVNPPDYTSALNPVNNSTNFNANQPPLRKENSVPSTSNGEGLHEVTVHRSADFQGFGFHLQYNKIYYIVQRIEDDSPAERSGLKENDVIREINHQPTDKMPHDRLVEVINGSSSITFLVQPFDNYLRVNPHVPSKPDSRPPPATTTTAKNDAEKRPTMLSKALTKLKSR